MRTSLARRCCHRLRCAPSLSTLSGVGVGLRKANGVSYRGFAGAEGATKPDANAPALLIERLAVGQEDGKDDLSIMKLAMNRPQARNAFNKAMLAEFRSAVETLRYDTKCRMVLITSAAPGMFCAGADLKERAKLTEDEVGPFVSGLRDLMTSIESLPMPTIALITGAAFGGGLELALACDIRLAASQATLGLTETSLAIIPGAGGTQRLPRIVGTARAKELIFRAKRLSAEEAHRLGLVNHVTQEDQLMQKATELCTDIAANGPIAVRLAKTAIQHGMQADLHTGLEIEKACYAQVIPTQDRLEGLTAFREKRKPRYQGR